MKKKNYSDGYDLYTKKDIYSEERLPKLKPFLNRETNYMIENLDILQQHLDLFLSKIENIQITKTETSNCLLVLNSPQKNCSDNFFYNQSQSLVVDSKNERFVCVSIFHSNPPKNCIWPLDSLQADVKKYF